MMVHVKITKKGTILEVSTTNSDVNSHSSKSSLNAGASTSEGNEHYVSTVDIRLFPKSAVHKETRKRKARVNPILTDTAVKAAMDSEVKTHYKSAGHKRLFSRSKEKARNSEELFAEMSDVKRKMTVNGFVLNVLSLTPCPEHPQSGYSALDVIQEAWTSVPA